jgi:hypothetical protein
LLFTSMSSSSPRLGGTPSNIIWNLMFQDPSTKNDDIVYTSPC